MTTGALIAEMAAVGLDVHGDRALAPLTTYGVGGNGACVVKVSSSEQVIAVSEVLRRHPGVETLVMGRGSNILIADQGFDGVVVVMSPSSGENAVTVDGDIVEAGGAMLMPVLARRSVGAGRGGLEWCVGIPGTVGGAVRMNAGGHGADMASSVVDATVLSLGSGQLMRVSAEQLGFYFRGSALSSNHVVLTVRMRTAVQEAASGTAEINAVVGWRREHQPGGRNAGSVFVNPGAGDESAGALIDASGLRGFTIGAVSVSEKHANFIQAGEGSTAADIAAVMAHVQSTVDRVHGIRIYSEVCLVGFSADLMTRFSHPSHSSARHVAAKEHLQSLLGDNV
ncbi:MAG: UDP-N-acetylmuramate dehydrogenase [Ilumatobacteraceae bacterium]|nr:UDP-N-acetylmuramate dehydrogenase [Ilumatobacteraceae bacterium]